MLTLIIAVLCALAVSAICSLTETTLYAVTWAHIEKLRGAHQRYCAEITETINGHRATAACLIGHAHEALGNSGNIRLKLARGD